MTIMYKAFWTPAKLILLLAAYSLSGCGSDSTPDTSSTPPEGNHCRTQNSFENMGTEETHPGFTELRCPALAEHTSDITDQQLEVIDNNHQYIERYAMADPNNQTALPDVDFSEKRVVFLHMGEQPSSNHLIQVTEVSESESSITITYEAITPCDDCGADGALTYPYCFIAIEQTDKPIVFNELAVTECWLEP